MSSHQAATHGASLFEIGSRPRSSGFSDPAWVGILMLLAALPYANTLSNDFIFTYDDGTQILKNPYAHSLRYVGRIFSTNVWSYLGTHTVTNYYRPLMTVGYLVCYKIFGPAPYGFHLASVTLHTAVVATVFAVTRRLTADRGQALAAAVVFALHPMHTEAVAWISAVTELEVTLFYLVAFGLFLEVARPGGKYSVGAALGMISSYLLALLSKEQALTLPVVALVYEHFYRDDRKETAWAQKVARYGALWLLGAAYVLFRIHFLGGFAPLSQRPRLGWLQALLAAIALLAQYLFKLVWPVHFLAFYVFPEEVIALTPWIIAGFAALVFSAWLLARLWRRDRAATFGAIWLLLTLAPVLNPRWMANFVFAERYLYLPSIGFCWILAWGWVSCWRRVERRQSRRAMVAAALVVAALCVLRIAARNRDWRDDVTLYARTLEVTPESPRVMDALGLAYWRDGQLDAAEQEWRRLLASHPEMPSPWNYLGVVLAEKKQYAEAVRCFRRSLELAPSSADAHLNLGAAYAEQERMDLAEIEFRAAISLSPLSVPAHNVLGKLYFDSGRLRAAEEQFRQSLAVEPSVAAYDYLGDIDVRSGDRGRAEQAFKQALALNASDSRAHFSLGGLYRSTGRPEQARREYLAGLETDPKNTEALAALEELKQR